MESPQRRIEQVLQNDMDRKFSLVINDIAMMKEGKQVYIRMRSSQLETFIYKKQKNRTASVEVLVDLSKEWSDLESMRVVSDFDYKPYLDVPGAQFAVTLNRTFGLLFIESPIFTLIKSCIRQTATRSINSLTVSGLPGDFWNAFKERWGFIHSEFQVASVRKYTILLSRILKRRVNNKLTYEPHRLFREPSDGRKGNFLYLFLSTSGLYNPFLENKSLIARVSDSWFFNQKENSRLFVRQGRDYYLSCMTVTDFCKSVGLPKKVGFTHTTALMFLFGLLYAGIYNDISVPMEQMKGYLVVDYDEDDNPRAMYVSEKPPDNAYYSRRKIIESNGMDAFVKQYAGLLSGGVLSEYDLKNLLVSAYVVKKDQ